jgi:hypothetical protein
MAMTKLRKLIGSSRGVALPLSLIVLAVLTMLIVAFLTVAGVEPQISQNLSDSGRARFLAEAGIEWAFVTLAGTTDINTRLTGPDGTQNTADDQLATNVSGQNTAASLTPYGSPMALPTQTTAGGTFSVTVRNDNLAGDSAFTGLAVDNTGGGTKFNDTNGVFIVTSTGTYRGASRTVQVAFKRIGLPPFPGAVNIPGFQADAFLRSSTNPNVDQTNAANYDIDGRDYNRDGTSGPGPMKLGIQVQPGIQSDLGISYESRAEQPFDDANVCSGGGSSCTAAEKAANRTARLGIVKGRNQSTGAFTTGLSAIAPDASLNPTVMQNFLTQIVQNPVTTVIQSTQACPIVMTGASADPSNPTLTNGCGMNQPVALGTPSDPKMVYFRGDPDPTSQFAGVTTGGTITGAGILIIEDGDFQQYANFRWDGIVLVTGKYVSSAFRTGSTTTIYGALVANETMPAEAGGFFDFFIDGDASFRTRSSKQNLDMVQSMLAVHRIISWREN